MKRASFQLDTTNGTTEFIATGNVSAVPDFEVEVAPGTQRPQATDDNGELLWTIDVLIEDGADRANCVGVRVPAKQQPVIDKYKPVQFVGLDVTVYIQAKRCSRDRCSAQLGFMYEGRLKQAPAAKAAA
jgi:hypothetical protein